MPVKIIDMAKEKKIPVLTDGTQELHAVKFAQDLDCDFYAQYLVIKCMVQMD